MRRRRNKRTGIITTQTGEEKMEKTAIGTIDLGGQITTVPMKFKEFSTGSDGFHGQCKVEDAEGNRYQTQIQMVRIGSKEAKAA